MQGVQHFLWLASGPPEGVWDVEMRGVPFAVLSLSGNAKSTPLSLAAPQGAWQVEMRKVEHFRVAAPVEIQRVQQFLWPRGLGSPLGRLSGGNAKSTALSRCCTCGNAKSTALSLAAWPGVPPRVPGMWNCKEYRVCALLRLHMNAKSTASVRCCAPLQDPHHPLRKPSQRHGR